MNPITDYPENEKPAKKKRMQTKGISPDLMPEHRQVMIVIDTKASNFRESNVMTREQWEEHLKKIAE